MSIAELKQVINNIPDDFDFEIQVEKKVSDDELKERLWKYPLDTEICDTERSNFDIGWSDEKCRLTIRIAELELVGGKLKLLLEDVAGWNNLYSSTNHKIQAQRLLGIIK